MTTCDHLAAISSYREIRMRLRNGPIPVAPPAPEPVIAAIEPEADAELVPKTMREIAQEVGAKYKVDVARMKSRAQVQEICQPRQEAMWRMHKEMDFSLTQIGTFFNRDHTTARSGIRRHQARIDAGEVML
jgi:chromosomal replication initiation ATPase DnaA